MGTVIYAEKCVGCRSCEMACSFHHAKLFSRKYATSIEIERNEKEGRFGIVVYRQSRDKHLACDCASGKEFCLDYCPEVARDELRSILNGK